ncbi:hypothetical protein JTM24_36925, partial [Pseudomonas aeruginosa]|nr:hypothetical protein [Pseudomonas aeruginosa]
ADRTLQLHLRRPDRRGDPPDARTRLLLNGQVAVKSLSDWLGAGQRPLPVSGRLQFQLNLLLDGKDSQLQIDSDLKGAVVDLPAPFGKTAAQAR